VSAAPSMRRRLALARWESGLMYRNGEQILLAFIIPIVLLVALQWWRPADSPIAVVITASLMATAFTSLAIALGFERRSGALRFLATTPVTPADLLTAKAVAQGGLAALSVAGVVAIGLLLGLAVPWLGLLVLVPLGFTTLAAWAFWMAGTFRAEAVLALANAIFVLLLIFGGVVVPATDLPGGVFLQWLPSALLADGLRDLAFTSVLGLSAWLVAGLLLARRRFHWD
jgi:ABC-2 type transport system permease protein